jgi:DNA helicase II / ATP-dependent DNA helicase PcrA
VPVFLGMALNEQQLLAANHPGGEAALLLAGAGSGKTATITERISLLIEKGVLARRILALTFTNKGAGAMRFRVMERTGLSEDEGPYLTTIHSLALRFIRRNPLGFGLQSKISILDDYDQAMLIKKIVERNEWDINPWKIRDSISYHRARGIGFIDAYTEEVHKRAQIEHNGYHALGSVEKQIWTLYEKDKHASSCLDFDDLIWWVNRRFEADPAWGAKVQALFEHVIMDEAQDTSLPCWQFVNHLLGPDNRNLYVVGDLSQSIMSFNGSCPQLIQDFSEGWRGSAPTLYRIACNHRSVPEIVTLANAIQSKMRGVPALQMTSFRGDQGERGKVIPFRAQFPREISTRIAAEILNSKRSYREFAILIRAATQIRDIEGELIRARVPYVVRGGKGLLATEEVRDVLAYLRFAMNPRDFSALSRSIGAPKRGVGDKTLEELHQKARAEFDGDLLQAAKQGLPKLAQFADTIAVLQGYTGDPNKAFDAALKLSGYVGHIRKKYAKEKDKIETKIDNLVRLRDMIAALAAGTEVTTEDLIFQLTMDRADKSDEQGAVTISTIHSAKGLEWPVVFVWSVTEGSLPHRFAQGSEAEIEEERRLFYVAVTRARDTLVPCIPAMYQNGLNVGLLEPSRFLTEIGFS